MSLRINLHNSLSMQKRRVFPRLMEERASTGPAVQVYRWLMHAQICRSTNHVTSFMSRDRRNFPSVVEWALLTV